MKSDSIQIKYLESNSSYDDFSPVFYNSGLTFSTNRKSNMFKVNLAEDNKFTSNIYFANISNGVLQEENLFSKELSSDLNEGPFCFNSDETKILITKNIFTSGNQQVLGIFEAHFFSNFWSEAVAHPLNSKNFDYNVAHPFLANNDQTIYFISDKPGGYGGYDIYSSTIDENGEWGEPINAGPFVNTKMDEGYPFISRDGDLYFSSNGQNEKLDADIFKSRKDSKNQWNQPKRIDEPINSSFNDYAFVLDRNGITAYFTSNREDGIDADIYSVETGSFKFENCKENYDAYFCYQIQDENISLEEDEFQYEWNLGNGDKVKGKSIQYCFSDYGSYEVSLTIYDAITKRTMAEVSNFEIEIEQKAQPHIVLADTVYMGETTSAYLDELENIPFSTNNYYWKIDESEQISGLEIPYKPLQKGTQRIYAGSYSFDTEISDKICVYKDVVVQKRLKELKEFKGIKTGGKNSKTQKTNVDSLRNLKLESPEDSIFYFIELFKSKTQTPLQSEIFKSIEGKITERYLIDEQMFSYTTGHEALFKDIIAYYKSLVLDDFRDAKILEDSQMSYQQTITKKGIYMSDFEKNYILEELKRLSVIHFESNSTDIQEKSFGNLNEIIKVLKKNEFMELVIKAHTDNVGREEYNMNLSKERAKSVMDYFIVHGISDSRLESKGYGSSKPIATNQTEKGRSNNRRVEFEIILERTFSEN